MRFETVPLLEMDEATGRPRPGTDMVVQIPVWTDDGDPEFATATLTSVNGGPPLTTMEMKRIASRRGGTIYVMSNDLFRAHPATAMEGTINEFTNSLE